MISLVYSVMCLVAWFHIQRHTKNTGHKDIDRIVNLPHWPYLRLVFALVWPVWFAMVLGDWWNDRSK